MASINLMPKDSYSGYQQDGIVKKRPILIIITSFLILSFSFVLYFALFAKNREYSHEINLLDSEIKELNAELDKEISNNEFLIAEAKAGEAYKLLSEHRYFTRAIDEFKKKLLENIYLNSLSISYGNEKAGINFSAIAGDYSSVATQIFVLKNSSFIEKISVEKVSVNDEGKVEFSAVLVVKRDIFLYKKSE